MDSIVKLDITRDVCEQAAEFARSASTRKTRQRLLVSQSVSLTLRDYLEASYGVSCVDGRGAKLDYVDLLDVNDFTANNWTVEVRTITAADEPALYVPTVPMIVGFLSDFYVGAVVDQKLKNLKILGFAPRYQVADADLTPNGLMAMLPADELSPINELIKHIGLERTRDEKSVRVFEEWTARAGRLSRMLEKMLGSEDSFSLEERERLSSMLNDEVLRLYGEKAPPLGVERLLSKLRDRFNLDEAIRSHPESPISFINSHREKSRSSDPCTEKKFLKDDLPVAGRVGLYRRLIESPDDHETHRTAKSLMDKATGGEFQSSARRLEHLRQTREIDAAAAEASPIPPPADVNEQQEIDEWFAEFKTLPPQEMVDPIRRDSAVTIEQLHKNTIVRGPFLPEPVEIMAVEPVGNSVKILGRGLETNQFHDRTLDPDQLNKLQLSSSEPTFDGDPLKFRIGIESLRLGLAYEYDPFFALSVARVDPLPHQLEAVYDYFLKQPRIRFLLADDPGAGKTIMAGLLLKELKLRGLVKRVLILTPAALSFQWQREMKDKFRENFDVVKGDVLRANYGSNPFQDKDQVVTSVSWVSVITDAKESLLRSHWDLIIVDEAHKLSAYSVDKKTMAYRLGETLFQQTDHLLLMTATPHKGDPQNFRLFLELLDRDVYGDIKSLDEAMRRKEAPFYLRRTKEALVTFPDPETGKSKKIFTKRIVNTVPFTIDADELDLYDSLSRYVEDQSIKAAQDDSARGRALGFTMAMLQRRFASSTYALRRSLERMRDKRQKILDDPAKYREDQIAKKLPQDFEDLTEEEQQKIYDELEGVVASVDPEVLREDIDNLTDIIAQALLVERSEEESKLKKLRDELVNKGVFDDKNNKMLIFTEYKDTLDFLVGKLSEWGLSVTQIHGGMHVGDRDTPGTRIYAEREFKESAQVMVATEAAGEGINLQFCWSMINYDIPWNPIRLEQRMGRIHRYGQEKDCLIWNFVSTNTREGRVLERLFERLAEISAELQKDNVFDVVGEMLPNNMLEDMFRKMYAHNTDFTEERIKERLVEEIDADKIRRISENTLEGLAKKNLNISALTQKHAEAKERRLVPEVVQDFFVAASPISEIDAKVIPGKENTFRVGRIPRRLVAIGNEQEVKFGKLGREYKQVVFDRKLAEKEALSEWVTPGHPLFEAVRKDVETRVDGHIQKGAILYDINTDTPYRLDCFIGEIRDGLGNTLHKRLFVVKTDAEGRQELREPTIFLDMAAAETFTSLPQNIKSLTLPDRKQSENFLYSEALRQTLSEVQDEREKESKRILDHVRKSLDELLSRLNVKHMDLLDMQHRGDTSQPVEANIKQVTDRIDDLENRKKKREEELEKERHCSIGEIKFLSSAWVLPHPEKASPGVAPMVRDEEIERRAVEFVIAHEEAQGRVVESVETQNRGFDLISRRPHPEDPQTAMDVRFIEVKGRVGTGEVAITTNEYRTAARLKEDYWLYVVFDCGTDNPKLQIVRNPARLGWEPLTRIEHYHVSADVIRNAE